MSKPTSEAAVCCNEPYESGETVVSASPVRNTIGILGLHGCTMHRPIAGCIATATLMSLAAMAAALEAEPTVAPPAHKRQQRSVQRLIVQSTILEGPWGAD